MPNIREMNAVPMPTTVAGLTERLMGSYVREGGINHVDGKNLPSKHAIANITIDLLRLLFPGFFDEKLIHSSEIEGVISQVYVREGDRVTKGQVIADMQDWERRIELSQSQAKYQSALLQMDRALAANDGAEAGVQRVQVDYWKAEVVRAQQRLDRTQLRSPIDGVVATPDVETMVGRRLQYGDTFAEVVDTSHTIVDIAIDDTDIGLVRTGERASIKLNSFPMRILRGDVVIVSPQGAVVDDSRVFYARVAVPNLDGAIHAGMEGRGKVRAGWYPAGYALFRRQLLWLYSKVWAWFGV